MSMWWLVLSSAVAFDLSLECPEPTQYQRPHLVARLSPDVSADMEANLCAPAQDREQENGCAQHYAWVPPEGQPRHQEQLVVFLPGYLQRPNQFQVVQATAAFSGYRVVGLSYRHRTHASDFCPVSGPDVDPCFDASRDEIVFGAAPGVTAFDAANRVDVVDSLTGRLVSVLEDLYWEDVNADGVNHQGWDQYLTVPLLDENTPTPLDASSIHWDRLIVVSFSAGTTDVAYLARQQMLDGAVYLDGPVEGSPDLNVWDLPMATPDCVQAGAYHADRGVETLQIQDVWTRMGVGTVELDADLGWSGSWPAGEMRFFSNQVPAPGGCIDPKHGSMARDGCIPSDPWNGLPAGRVYGTPSLFPTYVYLFCQVGAIEPVTCMPYQDLQPRDSDGPRLP